MKTNTTRAKQGLSRDSCRRSDCGTSHTTMSSGCRRPPRSRFSIRSTSNSSHGSCTTFTQSRKDSLAGLVSVLPSGSARPQILVAAHGWQTADRPRMPESGTPV